MVWDEAEGDDEDYPPPEQLAIATLTRSEKAGRKGRIAGVNSLLMHRPAGFHDNCPSELLWSPATPLKKQHCCSKSSTKVADHYPRRAGSASGRGDSNIVELQLWPRTGDAVLQPPLTRGAPHAPRIAALPLGRARWRRARGQPGLRRWSSQRSGEWRCFSARCSCCSTPDLISWCR